MTDNFEDLLSLDEFKTTKTKTQSEDIKVTDQPQAESTMITFEHLAAEDQIQAQKLAETIDMQESNSILNYGLAAQEKLGDFSQLMLDKVQNQDLGPIGNTLSELMQKIDESQPDELTKQKKEKGLFRIFSKVKQSLYETTAKYQQIGAQVDKIAVKLEREQENLLKNNQQLEQLYEKNKDFFKALTLYIAAGELKLYELETKDIPALEAKAEQNQDQMLAQELNDLVQSYHRLEKRIYDLKLARQITLQQAPQIRLIQNTNQALAEKIQSSLTTAIPLWKNQLAIALTLLRQQDIATSQQMVSETTNELLKQNSAMLKTSTLEVAKENERGLVDIDTLKNTQKDLIDTIQETLRIQSEGRKQRQVAEKELLSLEDELKEQIREVALLHH